MSDRNAARLAADLAGDTGSLDCPREPGTAIAVEPAIARLAPLLQQLAGTRVSVQLDLAPGANEVAIAPEHLAQILLDLVANARDAMPDGGDIKIATSRSDGDRGGLWIAVSDRGAGQGSGVELADARERVLAAGGRVLVDSRPDEGTTLWIDLPLAGEAQA